VLVLFDKLKLLFAEALSRTLPLADWQTNLHRVSELKDALTQGSLSQTDIRSNL
jgi:hypothetical protein